MRGRIGAQAPQGVTPWKVPVCKTVAAQGTGVDELMNTILGYRDWLEQAGIWQTRRVRQARARLREMVASRIEEVVWAPPAHVTLLDRLAAEVVEGATPAFDAAGRFLDEVWTGHPQARSVCRGERT